MNNPYLTYIGNPNAPAPLPETDPNSKFYRGGPLVNMPQPGVPAQSPYQGMFGAFQPPMINRGMFGNVSYPQFNMGYNPYQGYNPFAYGSPYMMNPYQGMFGQAQPRTPFDTTIGNGRDYDPTGGNTPMMSGSLPSFGLMGMLSELFGRSSVNTNAPSTSDSAYDSSPTESASGTSEGAAENSTGYGTPF